MLLEPKYTYIKASECKAGDTLTFLDEGEYVESKFEDKDGNPKKQFQILVEHSGLEKKFSLNSTNIKFMVKTFGKDTSKWVGQSVTLEIAKLNVAGSLKDVIYLKV